MDHDTTKSAVMVAGIPHPPAGGVSYAVIFDLARDLVDQGHAVIIDSPAVYFDVPTRGIDVASCAGVAYYFVECECPDDLADERIDAREARPSQVKNAAEAADVSASAARTPHRPTDGVLTLDTRQAITACVESVVSYLSTTGASGPVVAAQSS